MRRSATDKFREDLRLQLVYKTLLHYGMDTALEGSRFVGGFRHGMQTWVWRLPKDWESPPTAVKLRMMLEELGPTYVKIGQIVSSQASVLPPDWATELAKLQNAVPPFPAAQVRETIVEELGAPPEELYGSFEAEPFAAASTAQVHRATLHDGTQGGGQGPATLHPDDRPRRPRHHADRCPRGVAALRDGALARPRRHARAVLVGRARGARLPRRDLQRPSAGREHEERSPASTSRPSTPTSRPRRSSPRSSSRA